MMDYTDRHDRYFLRLISRHTLLYTEMVTTQALLNGDTHRHLDYDPAEHPLALQLGGSDPAELASCARIAEDYGYDEVNLNVGCPSDRVKNGQFGACLMATPERVADCVDAMTAATSLPITVKHRIGIDELDDYAHLHRFVATVSEAGCRSFIVHARKAWLQGLSPKENREIPPLRYDRVYQLKGDFPQLEFVLNGGIKTLDQAQQLLDGDGAIRLDGVMIGREAYSNPYLLHQVDQRFYAETQPPMSRSEVTRALIDYIARRPPGTTVHAITRHILGLYHGLPGARQWRRELSERAQFEPQWRATLEKWYQYFAKSGF